MSKENNKRKIIPFSLRKNSNKQSDFDFPEGLMHLMMQIISEGKELDAEYAKTGYIETDEEREKKQEENRKRVREWKP